MSVKLYTRKCLPIKLKCFKNRLDLYNFFNKPKILVEIEIISKFLSTSFIVMVIQFIIFNLIASYHGIQEEKRRY